MYPHIHQYTQIHALRLYMYVPMCLSHVPTIGPLSVLKSHKQVQRITMIRMKQ